MLELEEAYLGRWLFVYLVSFRDLFTVHIPMSDTRGKRKILLAFLLRTMKVNVAAVSDISPIWRLPIPTPTAVPLPSLRASLRNHTTSLSRVPSMSFVLLTQAAYGRGIHGIH